MACETPSKKTDRSHCINGKLLSLGLIMPSKGEIKPTSELAYRDTVSLWIAR